MTATDFHRPQAEEFEDGELPEDGEICDDEEPVVTEPKPTRRDSNERRSSPSTSHSSTSRRGATGNHRDYDSAAVKHDTDRSMQESWANKVGVETASADSHDFPPFAEDKDYRFEEESGPIGDSDYRQPFAGGRRRRHSPVEDDYEQRPKRAFPGRFRGSYRGGLGQKRFGTERQICKFFREGYCRDGDNCTYSHQAEDSLRRPELCKFYLNSFCKKGLSCLHLHGEFPCKAFHKGECSRDPCQFSHQPLTDYTRPMFEKMVADDEALARQPPQHPPMPTPGIINPARRRVLLPGGPSIPPAHVPQQQPPVAPMIHAPVPQAQMTNGQLAPPSVVVPTLSHQPIAQMPFPAMPPGYAPPAVARASPKMDDQYHPHFPSQPTPEPAAPVAAPPPATFNISQMLARIAGTAPAPKMHDAMEESPASPPPMMQSSSFFGSSTIAIPQHQATWRLLEVDAEPAYSTVSPQTAAATPQDPRMNRVLSSQFDAVSTLIATLPQPDVAKTPTTAATTTTDPRAAAAAARDPRRKPDDRKTVDDKQPTRSSWMPNI